eukprot:TRINITY_DN2914_c2_g2_i1.p1 TRINITY_DN2914_c2_g2~~TRINITY_DN2914_c2_g2_i1.p1  ORF type:complete len:307 (-),score=82.55 TRINITY_DN2914_c2_g2_i1:3-923(-)
MGNVTSFLNNELRRILKVEGNVEDFCYDIDQLSTFQIQIDSHISLSFDSIPFLFKLDRSKTGTVFYEDLISAFEWGFEQFLNCPKILNLSFTSYLEWLLWKDFAFFLIDDENGIDIFVDWLIVALFKCYEEDEDEESDEESLFDDINRDNKDVVEKNKQQIVTNLNLNKNHNSFDDFPVRTMSNESIPEDSVPDLSKVDVNNSLMASDDISMMDTNKSFFTLDVVRILNAILHTTTIMGLKEQELMDNLQIDAEAKNLLPLNNVDLDDFLPVQVVKSFIKNWALGVISVTKQVFLEDDSSSAMSHI